LRRAQLAAEAARPYAERLTSVDQSRRLDRTSGHVPRLLGGGDTVHLLVVCTAERVFAALLIPRSRARARDGGVAHRAGQDGQNPLCRQKGHDVLRRQFGRQIIEVIDLRSVRSLGFDDADAIGRKIIAFAQGQSSTSARCFLAVQVGDFANSDRAANYSARSAGDAKASRPARLTTMSLTRKKFSRTPAAQHFDSDLAGAS